VWAPGFKDALFFSLFYHGFAGRGLYLDPPGFFDSSLPMTVAFCACSEFV
jgi:hypothetical protein